MLGREARGRPESLRSCMGTTMTPEPESKRKACRGVLQTKEEEKGILKPLEDRGGT